jgi:hypothetical protein
VVNSCVVLWLRRSRGTLISIWIDHVRDDSDYQIET